MKTNCFYVLLLVIMFISMDVNAQFDAKTLPDSKLSGKVKSIKEYYSKNRNDSIGTLKSYVKYDFKGRKTENGMREIKWTYRYDIKSKLSELTKFMNDTIERGKAIYKYDVKGNKIEELFLDRTYKSKTTFKYTVKGELSEEKFYEKDDLVWTISYSYDKKGNVTIENKVNAEMKPLDQRTYNYDINGKMIEQVVSLYRKDGSKIEDKFAYKGGSGSFSYKYNEKGDVIEINIVLAEGNNTLNFELEYDTNNNWIKRTCTYKNDESIRFANMVIREIQYY